MKRTAASRRAYKRGASRLTPRKVKAAKRRTSGDKTGTHPIQDDFVFRSMDPEQEIFFRL